MTSSPPVAVITGASSGIGQAIAHELFHQGYGLALCARRGDRLQTLKENLQRKNPHQASEILIETVDLRQESQILQFFQTIDRTLGPIHALINNAGLGHKAPLTQGETALWREMWEVNVLALSICTREAIQRMEHHQTPGHIIHINSMSGHRVPGGSGMYSASKFAVTALTEALRKELRENNSAIRVSSISPGYVETEFAEKYHRSQAQAQETYGRFPVLQPQDIAQAVAYVLQQPPHVQVHDLLIRPTAQPS